MQGPQGAGMPQNYFLNILQPGQTVITLPCKAQHSSKMAQVIELITQICFERQDNFRRFFFYVTGDIVNPEELIYSRIRNQQLSIQVLTESDFILTEGDEILVPESPPRCATPQSQERVLESPEG